MIVSFDYDGTLVAADGSPIKDNQDLLRSQIADGNDVIVVTGRCPEDSIDGYIKDNFDVPVYYTCNELKYGKLDELGVDMHYDDNPNEIIAIQKNTDIEAILVSNPDKMYADKTVCVVDHGMYFTVARRLAMDFGKVYYYTPWETGFPTSNDTLVGDGFPDVERMMGFWDVIDEIDLFVFTDIYHSDLQKYLQGIGKRVWGARDGDTMEIDRDEFMDSMKEVGLEVPEYQIVTGVDDLRKLLDGNEDTLWIKMLAFERGDKETFGHLGDYNITKPILDDIEHKLGPWAQKKKFIVVEDIDTDYEIGYDGYCIDGKFAKTCLFGIEAKDKSYVGAVTDYDNLPDCIHSVNDALVPLFEKYQYRQMFSTEIRVSKDGKAYLIDPTCRFPSPPSSLWLKMVDNVSEILWEGSAGNLVEPVFNSQFGAMTMGISDYAKDHFYYSDVPEIISENCSFLYPVMVDGQIYTIPQKPDNSGQMMNVGIEICSWGDDMDDVVEKLDEMTGMVKAYKISFDTDLSAAADEVTKMIKK